MVNLQINNDVSVMLPNNTETQYEREKINRLGKEFPSEQLLFVVVDKAYMFKNMPKLLDLCNDLEKLKVVKSTLNPFNAIYFKKLTTSFTIARTGYPRTEEEFNQFIKDLTSNRFLVGSVISYDHKSAGILLRMNPNAMMGKKISKNNFFLKSLGKLFGRSFGQTKIERYYFCNKVEEVVNKYNKDFKIYLAGVPVIEAKTKSTMERDIFVLLIPAILLMAFIIFMNFRTRRGTILPLLTICLGLIWTMGIVGWMRYKLTIIGVIIPPIIITLGSSYSLYYLQSYYLLASSHTESRNLIIESTNSIWLFVLLAAITTIQGFVSFLFCATVPIVYFGFFVIISTIFIMFFTFFLLPNILVMLPVPKVVKIDEIKNDFFSKMLEKFRESVIPLRYLWLGLFFLSLILFVIFIPRLRVETDALKFFRNTNYVRQSVLYVQKNFHGSVFYNITIRSINNQVNYFKTRKGLLAAKKVQDYFDKNVKINGHTMLGWSLSPVTLSEDLNYAMTGKYGIPENEILLKRFLSFLKASNDDSIKSIMNNDLSAINFQVRLYSDNAGNEFSLSEQESSLLIKKLTKDLNEIAKKDGTFTVELWGEVMLLSNISKYLLHDQTWNLTMSVILVFLLMLVIFRSVYYSIIGLIPMVFAIIMNFTIMPIFDIPLDAATVLISSISIGVGIHNSIYFILFYKRLIREGSSAKDAILETLAYASRPIFFTSLALVIGFSIFMLSSFNPIFYFGLLIAIAMMTCTFATLFIMPTFFFMTDKFWRFFKKKSYFRIKK